MAEFQTLYITDTESTGLDYKIHDIIEISMIRLIPQEDGSYQEEQKTWKIKAMNAKTISDEALKVNKHDKNDILHLTKEGRENYKLPEDVLNEIEMWMLDDPNSSLDRIFCGQNPYFDIDFLKEFWRRYGKESDFPFSLENGNRILDTKQIVTLFDVCTGRRRRYYGLGQLVKACKVKKDKAHSASGDTKMTRDLLLKLVGIIRPSVQNGFLDCYDED